jgi:hypothetical protein
MRAALCALMIATASCASAADTALCPDSSTDRADAIPRYEHILVIIAENHGYDQIIGSPDAPNLNRLAMTYGSATRSYGEVHPSKANYIAMIGGDTFVIHDDDPYFCRADSPESDCPRVKKNIPYVDHTIVARSLTDQLEERHLTWKGYYESIPEPGSKAVFYPDRQHAAAGQPNELYAVKHNAFMQFRAVQNDPALASKIVGFDQLDRDLASGQVTNYAHLVPNQCNEMHGLDGRALNVPQDCAWDDDAGRVARADKAIGALVAKIQGSPIWSAPGNTAIVITWDEDDDPNQKSGQQGCCGYDPKSPANFGGGHIPTIVVTNHGPRGVTDDTPYNHYSLLRTTEDAFCIGEYLGHAGDTAAGVKSMVKLFQTK